MGDNNKSYEKEYFIELDLIEMSGAEAIQKIGEKGNKIYVDLDNVEREADNLENPNHVQFQEALDFIQSGDLNRESKEIILETGGVLSWNYKNLDFKEQKKIHHITRKKGIQSNLKRRGIECEFPRFLQYLIEIFDSSILHLNYQEKIFKLKIDELKKQFPDVYFRNNQPIIFNGDSSICYRISYAIEELSNYRFQINLNNGRLKRVNLNRATISGFTSRNIEQAIGFDSLMDNDIECSIIIGGSGSGKTIMAYAAAIEQILDFEDKLSKRKCMNGIVLFKANDIIGGKHRDEGFLPGTAFEKAKPYMQSYIDAHRLLGLDDLHSGGISFQNLLADPLNENDEFGKRTRNKLFSKFLPPKNRAIEIAHLRYARGRTFENQIILVDEAQNFSPFEIKQLIERVGIGCKLILIGDPEQIDNPQLDREFNGLVYAAHTFNTTHPRMSMIKLDKNYRSQSAEIMRNKKAPKVQ